MAANQPYELNAVILAASATDTAPPSNEPKEETVYLVPASATGAWVNADNWLAVRRQGAWKFVTPRAGMLLLATDTCKLYKYCTSWEEVGTGAAGGGDFVQLSPDDSSDNIITPDDLVDALTIDLTGLDTDTVALQVIDGTDPPIIEINGTQVQIRNLVVPTLGGNPTVGGNTIEEVGTPVSGTDAVNRDYDEADYKFIETFTATTGAFGEWHFDDSANSGQYLTVGF